MGPIPLQCKPSIEASETVDLPTPDGLDIDIDLDDGDLYNAGLDIQMEGDFDDDNEDDLAVSGDGIGEEDLPEGLSDVGERDELDPDHRDSDNNPASSHAKGREFVQPKPLPEWLQAEFSRLVHESSDRDKTGLPPLYRKDETFWFPRRSNFFKLQRCDKTESPSSLYNYSFFLWDPACLLPSGIPCPVCKTRLRRHDVARRPRRCVDISHTFWIIGYRYRCPSCINPQSRKNTVTFKSWDSRIFAGLPHALTAEFPAHLTYRSGISKNVLTFMRTCFQHGMGPKQFSNVLRVQHLQRHDEIHLQYLHFVASQQNFAEWTGQSKYEAFLPFDDCSPNSFHGYIPCAQWLRDIYDRFVASHRDHYNQHLAMLSARICAIDHSFKVWDN